MPRAAPGRASPSYRPGCPFARLPSLPPPVAHRSRLPYPEARPATRMPALGFGSGERRAPPEPGGQLMTETQDVTSIDALLLEQRRYAPPAEFATQANAQPDIYDRDPEEFWDAEARERISWFEPYHT